MKKCGHSSHKECAWDNRDYHEDFEEEEQYGACYGCGDLMNKGAYSRSSKNRWIYVKYSSYR